MTELYTYITMSTLFFMLAVVSIAFFLSERENRRLRTWNKEYLEALENQAEMIDNLRTENRRLNFKIFLKESEPKTLFIFPKR